MNSHLATIAASFCFDALLITSREDQETALSTCLLDCYSHELVDQFVQDDLAGDRMRHFDHRREIQVFDRCADRAHLSRNWRFFPEVWIYLFKLPNLPCRSPTEITVPGVSHVRMGDPFKAPRRVKSRS